MPSRKNHKEIIRELSESYHVTFNTKTTPSGNDGAHVQELRKNH